MLDLFYSKRLARAKDKDKVFEILDIKKNSKYGFFQQLTEIYVFAIALGLKNKKRTKISGPTSEAIHVSYFGEEQRKYFDLVCLYSEEGKLDALDKSSEDAVNNMKTILEEYANGGLEIILDKIDLHPENSFNTIKLLIDKELKEDFPDDIDDDLEW